MSGVSSVTRRSWNIFLFLISFLGSIYQVRYCLILNKYFKSISNPVSLSCVIEIIACVRVNATKPVKNMSMLYFTTKSKELLYIILFYFTYNFSSKFVLPLCDRKYIYHLLIDWLIYISWYFFVFLLNFAHLFIN